MTRKHLGVFALLAALLLAGSPRPASTQALIPAAPPAARAIPPGTKIAPEISDKGRVALILKIIDDVYNGRPLRFPKDGTVWENREGLLPAMPAGYYREYTVLPPAGSPSRITVGGQVFDVPPPSGTRGTERLIIGGGEILYYTPNHYQRFIELRILP